LDDNDRLRVVDAGLSLADCRSQAPLFGTLLNETAAAVGVDSRALSVRTLLQLPRVASHAGWVTIWHLEREVRLSAERLRKDARAARGHVAVGTFLLDDLSFEVIDATRASKVFTSLHYLRSARPGSLNFALLDPTSRLPVSLCSVSPLEWKCVKKQIWIQFAIPAERIWEVSRVYSIDHAPANTISYLLAKVRIRLRRNTHPADLMTTPVDPNLGLTGSSYRAANWQQWMTVRARPYLYDRARYITPRQLRERYGTSNPSELRTQYPGRFEQSKARLLDSLIYCCAVRGETAVVPPQNQRLARR
jgi:hypothetical protein